MQNQFQHFQDKVLNSQKAGALSYPAGPLTALDCVPLHPSFVYQRQVTPSVHDKCKEFSIQVLDQNKEHKSFTSSRVPRLESTEPKSGERLADVPWWSEVIGAASVVVSKHKEINVLDNTVEKGKIYLLSFADLNGETAFLEAFNVFKRCCKCRENGNSDYSKDRRVLHLEQIEVVVIWCAKRKSVAED